MNQNDSGGELMAQITLRGINQEAEQKIRQKAKKSGKSINRIIQEIINRDPELGSHKAKVTGNDLKKLAGGWNEEEASQFLESIKSCEQIDESMWK